MERPTPINAHDLSAMTGHWLGAPPNGYLGQSYGSDVKALLQSPMASGLADGLIAKLYNDVPLTRSGGVNVYSYDLTMDAKAVVFEVAGVIVSTERKFFNTPEAVQIAQSATSPSLGATQQALLIAAQAASVAAGISAATAVAKADEAAASAATYAIQLAQMAISIIQTQTIVVTHHGFT